MTSRSYVSLEQAACPACGKVYDTGAVLLDRRLQESMEHKTCTHWKPCNECSGKMAEGYVVLVAVDESKSKRNPDGTIPPSGAFRTGGVAFVRRSVWERVFRGMEAPDAGFCFAAPEVLEKLRELAESAKEEASDD